MKVCTYSRVSTSDKGQRPEIQVEEMRRFCSLREWEIKHEFVDHGFSGSSDKRPGLRKLLLLVQRREIDAVIVTKLDRLFRSLKHLVNTLDEFQVLGVQFVAIGDSVDFTTPSGRLMVQVLGALAEFEKALLRERTMMGLEHARRNGRVGGRPKLHDTNKMIELRNKGLSYREISKALHAPLGCVSRALRPERKTHFQATEKNSKKSGDQYE